MAELNRRALLMATPALAMLAAVPAFAAVTPDTSAWDAAMRAFLAAEAASNAYLPGFRVLLTEYSRQTDRIPHVVVGYRGPTEISTVDHWQVRHSRKMLADVAEGRAHLENFADVQESFRLDKLLVEAADERQAQLDAIRDRLGYDEADEKADELGDREHDARWALMNMPAPTLPALLWKLEYLLTSDESGCASWSNEAMAQTVADMRRLLGEAR